MSRMKSQLFSCLLTLSPFFSLFHFSDQFLFGQIPSIQYAPANIAKNSEFCYFLTTF